MPVITVNCLELSQDDLELVLEEALYEFPVREVMVKPPAWVDVLEKGHWLKDSIDECINENVSMVNRVRDVNSLVERMQEYAYVEEVKLKQVNLGTGEAEIDLTVPPVCLNKIPMNIAVKR